MTRTKQNIRAHRVSNHHARANGLLQFVISDFHGRLTESAKEFFAPARYLKSPMIRYRIEVISYVMTTLFHFAALFGDAEHCDDENYHFNNYDVGLALLTFGHAMNEVQTMVASYRVKKVNMTFK